MNTDHSDLNKVKQVEEEFYTILITNMFDVCCPLERNSTLVPNYPDDKNVDCKEQSYYNFLILINATKSKYHLISLQH